MTGAAHATLPPARWRRLIPWAVPVFLLLAGAGWWIARRPPAGAQAEPLFTVAQGPLTISVTEPGTIKPREQVTILSEVEGRATILSIVPEGQQVQKGDLLVDLDVSAQEDARVSQEIVVQNAQALVEQAREYLKNVRIDAETELDRAELTLQFAREDLNQYTNGLYPNALQEQEARIALAQRDQENAAERLKWSKRLFAETYLSETELRADELLSRKATLDVALATNNLVLLKDFTYRRRLAQLECDIRQADAGVDRTKRRQAANVTQAEVALRARESELRQQTVRLNKLKDQIAKGRILAPRAGMVVYATSAKADWRGNTEPLAAGQMVREREELVCLPTTATFMAEVKVHESNLDKIRVGQRARVTVDALPGKVLHGHVVTVAILPDATTMFMNPDLKLYRTEIHIDEGSEVLRTGMSCSAEIIVEQYDAAVFIPVQCVVSVKGHATVFVRTPAGIEPRIVRLGLDNNRMARILEGLEAGEQVLLAPPLQAGADTGERTARRPERTLKPPEPRPTTVEGVEDEVAKKPEKGALAVRPSHGEGELK
jgi:HlyD family secretion protein